MIWVLAYLAGMAVSYFVVIKVEEANLHLEIETSDKLMATVFWWMFIPMLLAFWFEELLDKLLR